MPPPPPRPDPYANPPSDTSFEVVNGVAVEKAMSVFDQVVGGIVHGHLAAFAGQSGLGRAFVETMFAIPRSGNDRKPDAGFVSFDRWPKARGVPRRNAWPVAPDLAVEVISPSEKGFDILGKLHEYFAGGVRSVWLLWPNVGQVYCYSSPTAVRILSRADELAGDPVVPGFRVPVADLFPPAEDDPPAA